MYNDQLEEEFASIRTVCFVFIPFNNVMKSRDWKYYITPKRSALNILTFIAEMAAPSTCTALRTCSLDVMA